MSEATAPPIRATGLVRTFDGGEVVAICGVELDVAEGETVAVTGASGSGKTTLLNILGLLDRPDSGHLSIDGIDVSTAREDELRRVRATRLGFVFQDALLDMSRTALENVMLGLRFAGVERRDRRAQAVQALAQTGTGHRADALGATLSGGERQRVAIARAIAHGPRALLCDEPTGALDEDNTRRVFELLAGMAGNGTAVVIVTHDLELARRCDRWGVLRSGRLHWQTQDADR